MVLGYVRNRTTQTGAKRLAPAAKYPAFIFYAHSTTLATALKSMKFFSQSFTYEDSWSIVSLAYFLRYPNPLASHIISCDVVSRSLSPSTGNLHTTRLILKRSAVGNTLPRWLPKGVVPRTESWVLEDSEVDPFGRRVSSTTRNLDHQKVMRLEEHVYLRVHPDNDCLTIQTTEARILSGFGWGLTKRIEGYGLEKFKRNIDRSRQGISIIVALLRESRNGLGLQPMALGGSVQAQALANLHSSYDEKTGKDSAQTTYQGGSWSKVKSWLWRPPPSL